MIENDKTQEVEGFEDLAVTGDRTRTVKQNQHLKVKLGDATEIDGARSLQVVRDHKTNVDGSQRGASAASARSRSLSRRARGSSWVRQRPCSANALSIGAGYMTDGARSICGGLMQHDVAQG